MMLYSSLDEIISIETTTAFKIILTILKKDCNLIEGLQLWCIDRKRGHQFLEGHCDKRKMCV